MSCREWEGQVALFVGGDQPRDETEEIERHLATCPDCRRLARDLSHTRGLLEDLGDEVPDEGALAAVRSRSLAAVRKRSRWPWLVAAAAALAIAIGISAGLRIARDPAPPPRIVLLMPEAPAVSREPAPVPRTAAVATVRPVRQEPAEPMVIKFLTDDPDVVIYWIAEEGGD